MAYTQRQIAKYYYELKTMAQNTGKPEVSMEELTAYLNSKENVHDAGDANAELIPESMRKIKDLMLHDIGGSKLLGDAFADIKEANDRELKALAKVAAQKEKKLMAQMERIRIQEAKMKLDKINDIQQGADARRKGYNVLQQKAYVPAKDRRQYVGRGYWNPLRPLLGCINFGFWGQRHANIRYPRTLKDAADNRITVSDSSGAISHQTEDGILRGYKYIPRFYNEQDPNRKVVLYFSGSHGPGAEYINNSVAEYVKNGCAVVNFDYRGFGRSETLKNGQHANTRLTEESMYKDAHEMFNYVVNTMGVKPENIILHGYSLGGPIASRVAADVSEANQIIDTRLRETQGKVLSESMRLGGLVLQSPMDSNFSVAKRTMGKFGFLAGPLTWRGDGGLNTRSHMERLHKYDPNIPVYITGATPDLDMDRGDHLSPEITHIHENPKAQFVNMKVTRHEGRHESPLEMDDPQIEQLAQRGRHAQLSSKLQKEQWVVL